MIKYSTKLGDKICDATAQSGISLKRICQKLKVPYSTATGWIYDPKHEMYNKYIHAKQLQLSHIADELCELCDDLVDQQQVTQHDKAGIAQNKERVSITRLRIQTRMNILTKLAPILYKTAPQKVKHTVTLTPPPDSTPGPTPPTPTPGEQPVDQSTDQQINHHSSPEITRKHLPDGTFEDYDHHGNLLRKSVKHINPHYADDVLIYSPLIR